MTNLENYPKILLNNIKSVDILEQGNSTAIAEFYVIEKGIGSKILAKQTIYPYSKQVIEVIDGDAKGTGSTMQPASTKTVSPAAFQRSVSTLVYKVTLHAIDGDSSASCQNSKASQSTPSSSIRRSVRLTVPHSKVAVNDNQNSLPSIRRCLGLTKNLGRKFTERVM